MIWVVKLYVTCKQIQDTLYKCFLPHGNIERSNIFECISNQTSMNVLVTHVWTVELAPTEWICSRAVVYQDSVEHGAKQVSLQWNPVLKKYELYLFTLKRWHCKFWIFHKATSANCPTFLRGAVLPMPPFSHWQLENVLFNSGSLLYFPAFCFPSKQHPKNLLGLYKKNGFSSFQDSHHQARF